MYRDQGPEKLAPVAETEFVGWVADESGPIAIGPYAGMRDKAFRRFGTPRAGRGFPRHLSGSKGLQLSGVAARVEYGARYGVGRDLLIPSRPMCKFPLN